MGTVNLELVKVALVRQRAGGGGRGGAGLDPRRSRRRDRLDAPRLRVLGGTLLMVGIITLARALILAT